MLEGLKTSVKELQCRDEYLTNPIESEILIDILEYVKYTPSTSNMQPWEIVIVTNLEIRLKLKNTLLDPTLREDDELNREWLAKAPLILVICMDTRRAKVRFGERGIEYALMDVGAAILSLMLGAWNCGVKGCCIRKFDQDKVSTILELPNYVIPLMLITLGYSNQEKSPNPTLELEDFVHKETWNGEFLY